MILYFAFMIFEILQIFALIEILKYIRYFTFIMHNEEYSSSNKMTFSEFKKFMKKK